MIVFTYLLIPPLIPFPSLTKSRQKFRQFFNNLRILQESQLTIWQTKGGTCQYHITISVTLRGWKSSKIRNKLFFFRNNWKWISYSNLRNSFFFRSHHYYNKNNWSSLDNTSKKYQTCYHQNTLEMKCLLSPLKLHLLKTTLRENSKPSFLNLITVLNNNKNYWWSSRKNSTNN